MAILTYSSLVCFAFHFTFSPFCSGCQVYFEILQTSFILNSTFLGVLQPSPLIPGVLQPSPYQVYFAERESQISLGLDAVNCTGWVEGFSKFKLFISKDLLQYYASVLTVSQNHRLLQYQYNFYCVPRLQQEELEGEREQPMLSVDFY